MDQMKIRKASGPSVAALEMFKAGGDKIYTFNDILFRGKSPEEWMLSFLVQIFEGKGDPIK